MRNHTVRASWAATVVAAVLALGSPIASSTTAVVGNESDTPTAGVPASSDEPRAFGTIDPGVAERVGEPRAQAPTAPRPAEPERHVLVRVPRDLAVRAKPSHDASVVGTMPSGSKYYDVPVTAWVEDVTRDGRWGRVEIPYVWPRRHGWIALRGLPRRSTDVEVHVDLSEHRVTVTRAGRSLFGMPAATGAAVSPTPPGEYFVTDRIAFSGGSLGTFAFGISGIQPKLPPGWTGGNQLAIHGTNDPASIGRSASAGCLRVSERALDRLKPLLALGTPVIVER
jgi:L,D-transpeptidase catalytic domain